MELSVWSRLHESLRERLLRLGAGHPLLRFAIRLQARAHGFGFSIWDGQLTLSKGNRQILLPESHYPVIPSVVHIWDLVFETVEPEMKGEKAILDFSKPGLHRYRKSGVSLWSPGLVEEDSMDAYTAAYQPQPGDVVWDVGAHGGVTSYLLAQMVGPTGKVFAFEPDDHTYEYLLRNIGLHKLENVVPVKKALAGKTGIAPFSMDGTVGAGIAGFVQCTDKDKVREVETLSFADACGEFGIPTFVKMDVEGVEADVIQGALPFLKEHPVRLAIETEHRVGGEFTSVPITRMLRGIGYSVSSSSVDGVQFTWAGPGRS
jgi:FkbM family methyltransferase